MRRFFSEVRVVLVGSVQVAVMVVDLMWAIVWGGLGLWIAKIGC